MSIAKSLKKWYITYPMSNIQSFRRWRLIVGFVLLFGIVPAKASTLVYTSENARIRNLPSVEGTRVLTIIPKGETLSLLEEKPEWKKVRSQKGVEGWMADWLLVPNSMVSSTEEGEKKDGVLLYNTRIRTSPEIKNNIIKTLPTKTHVTILSEEGEWFQVQFSSTKGWMMKEFVQVGSPLTVSSQPEGIDLGALNEYWKEKINELRSVKGLRELAIDQRFVTTATEWAEYMEQLGYTTHTRSDGKSMHQWIGIKGLDFSERYSENGWKTNYFTENIAWGIADTTTEGVKKVLDNTLIFFLKEASTNGDHYRTIYHPDWNSVGLGFAFTPQKDGKQKVFVAMHYGSLK